MNQKYLKLFYAAGPGDIVQTFRNWTQGEADPNQLAYTYSGQFFDLCQELGAKSVAISSCSRVERVDSGRYSVRNCPKPFSGKGRISYFLNQLLYGLYLLIQILRFRPQVAVIADGSAAWWSLFPAGCLGVKIVPSLHCVFTTSTGNPGSVVARVSYADRLFFRYGAAHCLCVSDRIGHQLDAITDAKTPWSRFFPTYPRETLANLQPPKRDDHTLRLLYSGRVESDKGVFLLVDMMRLLEDQFPGQVQLDICGSGSAQASLQDAVNRANLHNRVWLHGHCRRDALQWFLQQSQALVVPTTSHFVEGFNKVVAEGVLAGRPVIATTVCPAVDCLSGALIAVEPDSAEALACTVCRFLENPDLLEDLRIAGTGYRNLFFNPEKSWKHAFSKVLPRATKAHSAAVAFNHS
jgi:glycosyltransferase involved in cell wall biosynthesis